VIWLNAVAWAGAVAIAAPLLIHILVHRRARRFPFPTLRFIAPTRLAAVRRHVLEDLPLLAVRAGVLLAAAAALAGPLLLTPARQHTWNTRIVRAVVLQSLAPPAGTVPATAGLNSRPPDLSRLPDAFRTHTFDTAENLQDGIARAIAWLDTAPPARRELVIAAPLTLGSLERTDLDEVPAGIGIRLIRTGQLPVSRTVTGPSVLTVDPHDGGRAKIHSRTIDLNGAETNVRQAATAAGAQTAVTLAAPEDERRLMEAALTAVLSNGVTLPPSNRHAVVASASAPELFDHTRVSAGSQGSRSVRPDDAPSWQAGAVATLANDDELRAAARNVPAFLDDRFIQAPWHVLVRGGGGRPIIATLARPDDLNDLIVVTAAPPADIVTPILIRAVFKALALPVDLTHEEILPIPDAALRAWEREPGDVALRQLTSNEQDDRRWLWGTALALLGLESWLRRPRQSGSQRGILSRRTRPCCLMNGSLSKF
jgi:hypothetical protein